MFSSIKSINVNEVTSKDNVIDIRESNELIGGTIKGSKHIPMIKLLANPQDFLQKDKTYHILCQSSMRSKNACKKLSKQGYDVVNLSGGYMSYNK